MSTIAKVIEIDGAIDVTARCPLCGGTVPAELRQGEVRLKHRCPARPAKSEVVLDTIAADLHFEIS